MKGRMLVVGLAVALIFPMAFVALILVGAPMLAAAASPQLQRKTERVMGLIKRI